jgi:hypothetical protein
MAITKAVARGGPEDLFNKNVSYTSILSSKAH